MRHQARPEMGWPWPLRGAERLRVVPRPDPGYPSCDRASRPSTRPSSPCPKVSATSLGRTWLRSKMRSRPRWRRCCSSRSRVRVASGPPARTISGACAAVRRARGPVHGGRNPDRPRPDRSLVGLPALRRAARRGDAWPRPWATAYPSGPAGRGRTWQPLSSPGDHASTFGGQPLAASAARATLAVMEEHNVPALAEARGNYLGKKLAAVGWCRGGAGARLAACGRAGPGRRWRSGGRVSAKRARPQCRDGDGAAPGAARCS